MSYVDLTGRVAIVTGGAGAGCCSAISAAITKAGAIIATVDKDKSHVFAVADALSAEHGALHLRQRCRTAIFSVKSRDA